MKQTLLVVSNHGPSAHWKDELAKFSNIGQLEIRMWPDAEGLNDDDIHYVLAWRYDHSLLAKFPNLKLIISAGAGVDHLLSDPQLPDVPIVRFVDAHLTKRMTSYVASQTLFHTRRMLEFIAQQRDRQWQSLPDPLPENVRVGVMGLGELGQAVAKTLLALGFQVNGWSRSAKQVADISCYAGQDALKPFLNTTDILALLLPLTPQTQHIINRNSLKELSLSGRAKELPGPVVINPGRGGLVDVTALLNALDQKELYAASLDVFDEEPLDPNHALWHHPNVIITPHVASITDPQRIARYAIKQIKLFESGAPLKNLVDPARGY